MPPKKKKSSKKSSKQGKDTDNEMSLQDVEIDEQQLNKEFFVLHIKDLERKFRLYKEKRNSLQSKNDEYLKKEKEISQEKHDLISFLKKTLSNRNDEVTDINLRYDGLLQMKEISKVGYDSQLQEIRTKLMDTRDRLTTQNNILSAKLEALEMFKQEKQKYLEDYTDLEQILSDKKDRHKQMLESILNKQFHDKDRLKKEIVSKINFVAAEFRKISQKQTTETTKRTIRENVSIRTQLAKMDDKNIELMQENQQMQLKMMENIKRLKELDESTNDLAAKNSSHTKLLHLLAMKHHEHQEILSLCQHEVNIILLIRDENDKIKTEMESRKNDLDKLEESNQTLKETLSAIEDELEVVRERTTKSRASLIQGLQHLKELLQSEFRATSSTSGKSALSDSLHKRLSLNLTEIREWGDMQNRALAQEKLTKLLDALECDGDASRASSLCSSIQLKQNESPVKISPHSPNLSISFKDASPKGRPTPNEVTEANRRSYQGLSEYERRRQAIMFSVKQKKGFCIPGSLQTIPFMSKYLPTYVDKTRQLNRKLVGLSTDGEIERPMRFIESEALAAAKARFLADKPLL